MKLLSIIISRGMWYCFILPGKKITEQVGSLTEEKSLLNVTPVLAVIHWEYIFRK